MMGIIWGAIAATTVLGGLGIWLARRQEEQLQKNEENAANDQPLKALSMPIEHKLRNAIYECERNETLCKREIDEVCLNQLEILKDIGKPSYVEVVDKPLFFKYKNPLSGEIRYYYERDLNKNIEENVMERTLALAKNQQQHIELLESKIVFFRKLIVSHQENLERINGLSNQNKHLQKLNLYQAKLDELQGKTDLEREAIYNEYLLKEIHEELTFQEECFKQYEALNLKYNRPVGQEVNDDFKIKINDIIDRLEDQDPSKTI